MNEKTEETTITLASAIERLRVRAQDRAILNTLANHEHEPVFVTAPTGTTTKWLMAGVDRLCRAGLIETVTTPGGIAYRLLPVEEWANEEQFMAGVGVKWPS